MPRLPAFHIVLAGLALWSTGAWAQGLILTPNAEPGFRALIEGCSTGRAGADVNNADVSIEKAFVRVDLIRRSGGKKSLRLLAHHDGATPWKSRYFDVQLGEGSTEADALRMVALLDDSFQRDPFQVAVFADESGGGGAGLSASWRQDGFRGLFVAFLSWTVKPVSRLYLVPVIVFHALALLACLALLWGSGPTKGSREP